MLSEKSKYLQNVWALFILAVKISHTIVTFLMPCEQCTYLVCYLNYQIHFYVGTLGILFDEISTFLKDSTAFVYGCQTL